MALTYSHNSHAAKLARLVLQIVYILTQSVYFAIHRQVALLLDGCAVRPCFCMYYLTMYYLFGYFDTNWTRVLSGEGLGKLGILESLGILGSRSGVWFLSRMQRM